MDKNKTIILVLIVIIVILANALVAVMPNFDKQDSQVIINSNSTVYQGDTIDIILKDSNNTPISNQTVYVNITGGNNSSFNYSIITDSQGVGKLKINQTEGNITVNCTFAGNDKYNANSTSKNLTVVIKQTAFSQSSSSYSTGNSEPEYGSDSYVDKWDESQKNDGSWAYTHDQPVKSEGGHKYKRMYDEDKGKSYWYQMD